MILNFDTRDRQLKIIKVCFEKQWDVFFDKLFDYLTNPCYATESAFFYQLIYETSTQGDWTPIYMFDTGAMPEKTVIRKLSDSSGPKMGFNDMLVLRIQTEFATYYTKFWEEDRKNKEKMFKAYIKNGYELGKIDDYIGEFEKIK